MRDKLLRDERYGVRKNISDLTAVKTAPYHRPLGAGGPESSLTEVFQASQRSMIEEGIRERIPGARRKRSSETAGVAEAFRGEEVARSGSPVTRRQIAIRMSQRDGWTTILIEDMECAGSVSPSFGVRLESFQAHGSHPKHLTSRCAQRASSVMFRAEHGPRQSLPVCKL